MNARTWYKPVRIIPRLDIKGPNLVKGINLEGLRVLGTPQAFARHYYQDGADELLYIDIVASLYGRNSLVQLVRRTSKEIFIPLTVGGGLRSIGDIRSMLRAGADKVALNTAALKDTAMLQEAIDRFGSSTIVVNIEAKRRPGGHYEAFTENGREPTNVDAIDWAVQVAEMGAGEILLTSIDREGTGDGFDIDLTRRISNIVPIPVIACGGAGGHSHIHDVILAGNADAVGISSIIHYDFIKTCPYDDAIYTEGNVDFLRDSQNHANVQSTSLSKIRESLMHAGIAQRQSDTER